MNKNKYEGPLHIARVRAAFLDTIGARLHKKNEPAPSLVQYQTRWPELVGYISKFSYPVAIKGTTLVVQVSQSVYLVELQFQKGKIEKQLRQWSKGNLQSLRLKYGTHLSKSPDERKK